MSRCNFFFLTFPFLLYFFFRISHARQIHFIAYSLQKWIDSWTLSKIRWTKNFVYIFVAGFTIEFFILLFLCFAFRRLFYKTPINYWCVFNVINQVDKRFSFVFLFVFSIRKLPFSIPVFVPKICKCIIMIKNNQNEKKLVCQQAAPIQFLNQMIGNILWSATI